MSIDATFFLNTSFSLISPFAVQDEADDWQLYTIIHTIPNVTVPNQTLPPPLPLIRHVYSKRQAPEDSCLVSVSTYSPKLNLELLIAL